MSDQVSHDKPSLGDYALKRVGDPYDIDSVRRAEQLRACIIADAVVGDYPPDARDVQAFRELRALYRWLVDEQQVAHARAVSA